LSPLVRNLKAEHSTARRGMSLVELAIVIAIIGIVLGAIWVAVAKEARNARVEMMSRDVLSIVKQLQNANAQNSGSLNIGSDNGCYATRQSCPTVDPSSPGNYSTPVTQYCGTLADGTTTCKNGSSYGFTTITSKTSINIDKPMPTGCDGTNPYYHTLGSSSNSSFTSMAISMGAVPADLIKSGAFYTPWGSGNIGTVISNDTSCSAGSNAAMMNFLVSSDNNTSASIALNSSDTGYTPGQLTYKGQFYLTFTQVPTADCAAFLQGNVRSFVNAGLTQVCVGTAGSSGSCLYGTTITSAASMPFDAIALWCSVQNTPAVSMELVFSSAI